MRSALIDYPMNPHEYRGWTYHPIIDQDSDRFDRVMHSAKSEALPAAYAGDISISGSAFELLSKAEFEAEIDRLERDGLPPPPREMIRSSDRKPLFAKAVEILS